MTSVVLIIHLIIALALVALVLLQRSEGGALGIGGGGGGGGMFSGRGAASVLTRSTAVLAAAFFGTSILLTILARNADAPTSVFEGVQSQTGEQPAGDTPGDAPVNDALPQLGPITSEPAEPQVPVSE